jgi:hypothetical protein
MVGLSDTPLFAHRRARKHHWLWVILVASCLVLAYAGFGRSALIPIGNAQGLDVQIDFRGYDGVTAGGVFNYARGKTVHYQVIVTNKTNVTLAGLQLQSMLQGMTARLNGHVVSPPHKTSLSPGQVYKFDVAYDAPEMSSAAMAQLIVNARYSQRGIYKSDSFLCPTSIRLK